MQTLRYSLFLLFLHTVVVFATDSTQVDESMSKETNYRIEQPGTITFTVGIKIKGKVAKPQVMIFLPKEKSLYRDLDFSYSFKKDLGKSIPFEPIIE